LKIKFSIRAKASGTFNPFLIVVSITERIMAKFCAACSAGLTNLECCLIPLCRYVCWRKKVRPIL